MKNIFFSIAIIFVIVFTPFLTANAQSQTTVSVSSSHIQLITQLLEQVKILQAKLEELRKSKMTVTLTDKDEYQSKVKPLLSSLESKEQEIEDLEKEIEEKKCNKPLRYYSDGVRKFRCLDDEDDAPVSSSAITRLEEKLPDLLDEKADIEEKIERLKTEFGV